MKKKAIIVHSGGMDSSLCLCLALKEFNKEDLLSLSFSYGQRHSNELFQAKKIAAHFGVDHFVLEIPFMSAITSNALINGHLEITHEKGKAPNTLVTGRNGLMAHIAAIHAESLSAFCIYMGIMGLEGANSGYRDCSREYMDLMEKIIRLDLNNPTFEIRTPLVDMTKKETMALADSLGVLDYLFEETITCYKGLPRFGCEKCPACLLRNEGYREYKGFSLFL